MASFYLVVAALLQILCCVSEISSQCLNNYEDRKISSWSEGSVHKYNFHIKPDIDGTLRDWQLEIEFTAPLASDLQVWIAEGNQGTQGKTKIILTPMSYNQQINNYNFDMSYIAAFNSDQGAGHLKCVQFCGTLDSGEETCSGATAAPPVTDVPPVTDEPPVTGPLAKCDEDVVQSDGSWNTGYNGHFLIYFPETVHDWTLTITVDKPFSEIRPFDAKYKSTNERNTYEFRNRGHNGYQEAGSTLRVPFGTRYDDGIKPNIVSLSLSSSSLDEVLDLCRSGISPTGKTTQSVPETTEYRPTPRPEPTTTRPVPASTRPKPASTRPKPATTRSQPDTTASNEETTRSIEATTTANTQPPTVEPAKCTPKYNYSEVLEKSLLFYEAQRSGKLPSNKRIPWRKDSALKDGSDHGNDLTGGYYDAGDYVKFGFPMASSITNLAWGMIEFKKGYIMANQLQYGLDALKWGTDYFLKCHTATNTFWGQVGDGDADHAVWGRPEDMTMQRPSFKIDTLNPGSELAGETAAALAASSIVFKDNGDEQYAATLLKHAEQLFEFADSRRKSYHESIPQAANFYRSYSSFEDELAWACLWLYKASGKDSYRNKFLTSYDGRVRSEGIKEFSWDNKWAGAAVLAAQMRITSNDYLSKVRSFIQNGQRTPKGLFFVQKWGPNRHAANVALLSLIASKVKDVQFYEKFSRQQIHYMLGDSGRSFVVGFGTNPPQRPHHRSSSCPDPPAACGWDVYNSPGPNPHVLFGALVGGPDANDQYEDRRSDYIKNEVAMDYNAGFQSVVAGLVELTGEGKCGDEVPARSPQAAKIAAKRAEKKSARKAAKKAARKAAKNTAKNAPRKDVSDNFEGRLASLYQKVADVSDSLRKILFKRTNL